MNSHVQNDDNPILRRSRPSRVPAPADGTAGTVLDQVTLFEPASLRAGAGRPATGRQTPLEGGADASQIWTATAVGAYHASGIGTGRDGRSPLFSARSPRRRTAWRDRDSLQYRLEAPSLPAVHRLGRSAFRAGTAPATALKEFAGTGHTGFSTGRDPHHAVRPMGAPAPAPASVLAIAGRDRTLRRTKDQMTAAA